MKYRVANSQLMKRVEGKYGELAIYALTLDPGDGSELRCELSQKSSTPKPEIDAFVEGAIEETQYGPRFKKDKPAFNGNARAPMDPKKDARITRMACLRMATDYLRLKSDRGEEIKGAGVETLTVERVYALVMQFEQFIGEAG